MLSKIIEDFEKEFPNWSKIDSAQFDLAKIMTRWQDPKTADSILKGLNIKVLMFLNEYYF